MTSKYLGCIFDGWKVAAVENVNSNHKRFFLTKCIDNIVHTIMVRDNELTKLARKEKTISQLLAGKALCCSKNIRIFQNTIYKM